MDALSWREFLGPIALLVILTTVWGVGEIAQTFRGDTRRALFNAWAGLLLVGNAFFSLLVFVLLLWLFPDQTNYFLAAIGAAIGGQALLRAKLNVLQPLGMEGGDPVAISLADSYGRFQQFCREEIDRVLVEGRMKLLEQAIRLPVAELEEQVRLRSYASSLHPPDQVEAYLQELRGVEEDKRALLLAAYLLREGGFAFVARRTSPRRRRRLLGQGRGARGQSQDDSASSLPGA